MHETQGAMPKSMGPAEVQKYVKAHGLEEALSTALNEAVAAKTDAPLLYVADVLDKIADEKEGKEKK